MIGRADFDTQYLDYSVEAGGIRYLTQEEFIGLIFMGESLVPECFDDSHPGVAYLFSLPNGSNFEAGVPGGTDQGEDRLPASTAKVDRTPPLAHVRQKHAAAPPSVHDHRQGVSNEPKRQDATVQPTTGQPFGQNRSDLPRRASTPNPAPEDFRWPVIAGETSREPSVGDSLALNAESDLKKLGYSVARDVSVHERRQVLECAVGNLGLKKVANHVAFLIRYFRNDPGKHDAVANWQDDLAWLQSHDWTRSRN